MIRVKGVMKNGLLGNYAGFYGRRIKAGEVFALRSPDDFSDAGSMKGNRWGWMEPADEASKQALLKHFRAKGIKLSFDTGEPEKPKEAAKEEGDKAKEADKAKKEK